MNTVKKGDQFENQIFALLKQELSKGQLGIESSSGRIFKKKGYFSNEREKEIIVDIAIEVWLQGAKNYSLLWICECKNYTHSVPVDDLEEFKSKLDQIAGKNVKGVIATRSSLQSGALTYAKNQGIGVVRVMPDDQVKWVMAFMTFQQFSGKEKLNPEAFNQALQKQQFQSLNRNFYCVYDGYIFGDWQSLLRYTLALHKI